MYFTPADLMCLFCLLSLIFVLLLLIIIHLFQSKCYKVLICINNNIVCNVCAHTHHCDIIRWRLEK